MATGRTLRTPRKEAKLLAELRFSGNVTAAARLVGVGRRTAYEWREQDPALAQAWDEAVAEYVDGLEAEADRRAVEGVSKPLFYKGTRLKADVREYSDTLLIFRLKALRPQQYRERVQVSGDPDNPLTLLQALPDADLDALITRRLREAGYSACPGAPSRDGEAA